jgi:exosortase
MPNSTPSKKTSAAASFLADRLRHLTLPMMLISSALLLFTIGKILFYSPDDNGKSLFLLLLAVALFINSSAMLPKDTQEGSMRTSVQDKLTAWCILILFFLSFVFLRFSPDNSLRSFADTIPAMLFFTALFCFWGGIRSTLVFILPILICTMVIPNRDLLALLLSYPLRLLSTIISVESLQRFGCNIEYHLTSIRLPDAGIAITDACSGIDQLEILLLLGYLLVKMQHRRKRWAFLHYLFILPTVVLANAIRITITVLLFYRFGQRAFADPVHLALGYLLVIAVVFLLWSIGPLFPDSEIKTKT